MRLLLPIIKLVFSPLDGPSFFFPTESQAALIAKTKFFISLGSKENFSSIPPLFLSNVKCLSIIVAPRDTAATEAPIPKVWSENPTSQLNFFLKKGIVAKFDSFRSAGYALVHFNKIICLHPFFLATFTLCFISLSVAIPKEIIIGLPVFAKSLINLKSVFSGEATLKTGTLNFFKNFIDVSSNGVLK